MIKMLVAAAALAFAMPVMAAPGSPMVGKLTVGMTRAEVMVAYPDAYKGRTSPSVLGTADGDQSKTYMSYDAQDRLLEARVVGYQVESIEASLIAKYGEPRVEARTFTYPVRDSATVLNWQKDGVAISLDKRQNIYYLTYRAIEAVEGL
jgi:hypothetical protein